VGHAGARLLADVADVMGLTAAFSEALAPLRVHRSGHDPGRVAVDVAVMLADGGEAIADLAVLRAPPTSCVILKLRSSCIPMSTGRRRPAKRYAA
jgi:hypothetical protein